MYTGLTDSEKESLLKLFLTSGELKWHRAEVLDGKYQFCIFEHSRLENLDKGYVDLISKAMMNLRDSGVGF